MYDVGDIIVSNEYDASRVPASKGWQMEKITATLKMNRGQFEIHCFDQGEEHPSIALTFGDIRTGVPLVRIQSECLTGHVFSSLSCDCAGQRDDALDKIVEAGSGILIHLWQEGRGIGLADKMRAYARQMTGVDTVDANLQIGREIDERTYDGAAMVLKVLGVAKVRLITNNPTKAAGLVGLGIEVAESISLPPRVNEINRKYLQTKIDRLGHTYELNS
ncbi:GTP cyclohydrolase II [Amycolatopsis sp. NPDC051716]|uniref:GTP cyclohydrolase II n=1 Tax=Amycolatopsis sp. NPDC051716 TaxID=3155804 RepID=UPI0034266517